MANSYITVKAPREEGVTDNGPFKTVLWEKHSSHPHKANEDVGEVFITTDGKEVRVGETAAIKKLLMEDRLVKVEVAKPVIPKTT